MISIIIPVFNAEKTIEILVNNISKTLANNYDFEIILINDCSKDNSEEKCKDLTKKYTNVFLYSLSKNVGEHNAVMAGLNKCIGNYAVIMDDDLQHTADSLLELFRIRENIDNFNKKALYILIRERTGLKTQNITKVVNKMKKDFTQMFLTYQKSGNLIRIKS